MTDRPTVDAFPSVDQPRPLHLEALYRNLLLNGRGALRDTTLTQPGLRVEKRPLTGDTFSYYGTQFEIDPKKSGLDPQKTYCITELEIGILALYDADGAVAGIVNVHPERVDYQHPDPVSVILPEQLFNNVLLRTPSHFNKDWEKFLQEVPVFFSEQPTSDPGRPSLWDIWHFPDHPNANGIALEGKYYLWRFLSPNSSLAQDQQGSAIHNATAELLNSFGAGGLKLIESLEGDPELLLKLVTGLRQFGGSKGRKITNVPTEFPLVLRDIAELETFIVEAAATITPPHERDTPTREQGQTLVQKRINFLLPMLRAMVREMAQSFATEVSPITVEAAQKRGKDPRLMQVATAINYHGAALSALKGVIRSLKDLYSGNPAKPRAFDLPELDIVAQRSAQFPNSTTTHWMHLARFAVQTAYNQKDMTPEDRNAWLDAFYRHVIALGVYHEKANVYADTTGREQQRLAMAMAHLAETGQLPRDYTLVSFGCGNGLRVDAAVLELLAKEHPGALPGKVIGIDMVSQGEGTLWERESFMGVPVQFIRARVEELPEALPEELRGNVHVLWGNGSPLNNMDLLAMHIRYLRALAACLAPGGILMYETGSALPAPKLNERRRRAAEYAALFPYKPPYSLPVHEAYRRPDDDLAVTGAYIYPDLLLASLAQNSGLQIISPPSNPVTFYALLQDVRTADALRKRTLSPAGLDPFQTPWYMAGAETYNDGDDVNARGLFIFQKVGTPTANPFLDPFAESAARQTEA